MVNAIQKTRGLYLIGNKSNNVSKMHCFEKLAINKLPTLFKKQQNCVKKFLPSPGFEPTTSSTNLNPFYPLHHCYIYTNNKNLSILKKIRYTCHTNPKMKNSRRFTELFQWTKRCAGKIPIYGGKNKSGLLAEKKQA